MRASPLTSDGLLDLLKHAAQETVAVDGELFSTGRAAVRDHTCNNDAGHRASERSIVFHLARRLVPHVSGMSVDVEYNRRGPKRDAVEKKLKSYNVDLENRVFPDLIVHRRGTDKDNLLVVECKINARTDGGDPVGWCGCAEKEIAKLAAYREDLAYQAAVFLNFRPDSRSKHSAPVGFELFMVDGNGRVEVA